MRITSLLLSLTLIASSISPALAARSLNDYLQEDANKDNYYAHETPIFDVIYSAKYWAQYLEDNNIRRSFSTQDSIPQRVVDIGVWSNDIWERLRGELGYLAPQQSKVNNLSLFLLNLEDGQYGVTALNDQEEIAVLINDSLTDDQAKTTLAHEIFHVFQHAYDPLYHLQYSTKMAEGTAIWFEDEMYDDINDYVNYLDQSAFTIPEVSIFGSIGEIDVPNSISRYGSFLWYRYLSEKFGSDIIRELWEDYYRVSMDIAREKANPYYRGFLSNLRTLKRHDVSIKDAFAEFGYWNLNTTKYEEGRNYLPVEHVVKNASVPFSTEKTLIRETPELFATNYLSFNLSTQKEPLTFTFRGTKEAEYIVTLVNNRSGSFDEKTLARQTIRPGEWMEAVIEPGDFQTMEVIVSVVDAPINTTAGESVDQFTGTTYPYFLSIDHSTATPEILDLRSQQQSTPPATAKTPSATNATASESAARLQRRKDIAAKRKMLIERRAAIKARLEALKMSK